jgi:hypothetical protein
MSRRGRHGRHQNPGAPGRPRSTAGAVERPAPSGDARPSERPDGVPPRAEAAGVREADVVVETLPAEGSPAHATPPAASPAHATPPAATLPPPGFAAPPRGETVESQVPRFADAADLRVTCTVAQLRRFIKSRPWIPMHELRRRFGIYGGDDDVSPIRVGAHTLFIGLPPAEARLMAELLGGGDVGFELSLDPITPVVVGVYPMRPVPRG